MARRKITQELYDNLLAAFRESPGNANSAAREAGCDRRTAKLAYERGWPKQSMQAIVTVLQEERKEIRAMRAEDERKRREAALAVKEEARRDAMATKTEEGRAVANMRRNALAFSSVFAKILQGLIPASELIKNWLTDPKNPPSPKDVAKLLGSMALSQKMITDSLRTAMELERLRVGNPDEIINTEDTSVTVENAQEALERLQRTLRRAQSLGQVDGEELPLFSFDDEEDFGSQVH